MTAAHASVPYPPIERHGVIGDRRTAALVAADGTLDWFCLPVYDSPPLFGALLDAEQGGFWRFGPAEPVLGVQRYLDGSAALVTAWGGDGWQLELTDAMAWTGDGGPQAVLRRLRCLYGPASCRLQLVPRYDFVAAATATPVNGGLVVGSGAVTAGLWSSLSLPEGVVGAGVTFDLEAGEEAWVVLAIDQLPTTWTVDRARAALDETVRAWHDWSDGLTYTGPRGDRVKRSALLVHLLGSAPAGSVVAAPTTSLPERLGGDRNYDYRYAWVRDASLSLAVLAMLGDTGAARRYMDWLVGLDSSTDAPLQVVYGIDGRTDLTQSERNDLAGYRESRPVRIGNHAFSQRQLDSLGYFVDCVLVYLESGGSWRDDYWHMVRRAADYTVANWQQPDSGIWELSEVQHYVSSKVMSWVALDRAVRIAEALDLGRDNVDTWQSTMVTIHQEVMTEGWSEQRGAFRQRYGSESLDASALLIPVMGFLPADHPRVLATIDRIAESLTIDGFVHRFLAAELPGEEPLPLGAFEGAFLPCTFWLATSYAKSGCTDEAESILAGAEAVAGTLGLFAEEVDARSRMFLGNYPLLFAQVEYVRAVLELAKARPLDRARMMVGMLEQRVERMLDPLLGKE